MSGPIRAYPVRRRGFFAKWLLDPPGPVGAYPVRRRGATWLRQLAATPAWVSAVIALLVLLLTFSSLVIVDTALRINLQRRVAASLSASVACQPTVQVGGMSTLWQVAQHRLDQVRARCAEATITPATGEPIKVRDLRFEGHNVRGTNQRATAVMDDANISAMLSYESASQILGMKVTAGESPRINIVDTLDVSGSQVAVTYTALVGIAQGELVLSDAKAEASGVPVPQVVVDQMTKRILKKVTLPRVGTMTISSIVPTNTGMLVTFYGTQVPVDAII